MHHRRHHIGLLWLLGLVCCSSPSQIKDDWSLHQLPPPPEVEPPHFRSARQPRQEAPAFDDSLPQNVTAIEGQEVKLQCRVFRPGNKTVSWIRRDNLIILSVGRYTYTSDQRFTAMLAEETQDVIAPTSTVTSTSTSEAEVQTWILRIRPVQMEDAGWFGCQIGTKPVMNRFVHLRVVVPVASIVGKPELFVDVGSTINITCLVQHAPEPLGSVEWRHWDQPIDYTSSRGGVNVLTNKAATTISSLIIQRARPEDGGKYSCHAGRLVKPATIKVHVLHGDNYKRLQANAAAKLVYPISSLVVALSLIFFFSTLKCTSSACAKITCCRAEAEAEATRDPSTRQKRNRQSLVVDNEVGKGGDEEDELC